MTISLRPLHAADVIPYQSFTIHDGDETVGYVVTTAETAEAISSALRASEDPLLSPRSAEPPVTPNSSETPNAASTTELPPNVTPNSLERRLEQCGYDPLREARIFRELAEESMQRLDTKRAGSQTVMTNYWLDVFELALAAGIELRGESARREATVG